MKKISLLIVLTVSLAYNFCVSAQEVDRSQWKTTVDTSAFDGISRICGVFGKSSDAIYTYPQLALSKRGSDEISVYLTYWPYGGCSNNTLFVKFDQEANVYEPSVYYVSSGEQFMISFQSAKVVARNSNKWITKEQFIQKLKTCKTLYMRLVSSCVSIDVEFTLAKADEVLALLK